LKAAESVPEKSAVRSSSIGADDVEDEIVIAAIEGDPTPIVSLKTKRQDMSKVFINETRSILIPLISEVSSEKLNSHAYRSYLQQNFTQFTLAGHRHVMFITDMREIVDKESQLSVVDVVVHENVEALFVQDELLTDKVSSLMLYIYVLRCCGLLITPRLCFSFL
jgi:hypothetical protein